MDRFADRVQKVQKAQWGRLTAPSAPKVLKVLRFHAACGCKDCGGGCAAIIACVTCPLSAPAVILSGAKNLGTCR